MEITYLWPPWLSGSYHPRFKQGDVVGLLLDCDAGTLTVKKNGRRLGVAATGLTGEFCWALAMMGVGTKVRVGFGHIVISDIKVF
jgi:hypothetical protein